LDLPSEPEFATARGGCMGRLRNPEATNSGSCLERYSLCLFYLFISKKPSSIYAAATATTPLLSTGPIIYYCRDVIVNYLGFPAAQQYI